MAEQQKPGIVIKGQRPPVRSSSSTPEVVGNLSVESSDKINQNGFEDKILSSIKTHDVAWLKAHAVVDSINPIKADIFLMTALRANHLDTLEVLLQKGFRPTHNGTSERSALAKGGEVVALFERFIGRTLSAPQRNAIPAVKPQQDQEAVQSEIPQASDLNNSVPLEEFNLLAQEIEVLRNELSEKQALLDRSQLEIVEFDTQVKSLNEMMGTLEGNLSEAKNNIIKRDIENENLQIEMALHKSGRVKFQFDPHEPDEYDKMLAEALITTTGKACAVAVSENSLNLLKNKLARIRPSKRTLGPLFTNACEKGDLGLAQTLFRCGAPIDYMENLPMARAAKHWQPDVVFWLARCGADWHFAGEYPLRCAARHGDSGACIGLWRMGASINARDGAALLEALRMGHVETVLTLISLGINVYNSDDEIVEELMDIPEILEHINTVRDQEKVANGIDALILERCASKLGKDWISRRNFSVTKE